MSLQLATDQVWQTIEKEIFAVIGMVTAKNEARTVGINYVVRDRKLYFGSNSQAWKVRHIAANAHVSITIPIDKRIHFVPWFKIPDATITFSGRARVLQADETSPELRQAVFRPISVEEQRLAGYCVVEVTPEKDFITYGVGIPLIQMRTPEKSHGRAPVNGNGRAP